MLDVGVPVGAGTDATRVASYDPWTALYWLTTGRTVGGTPIQPRAQTLDRETALRLWTQGSAWFSGEADVKGTLAAGQYADLAVLSADFMTVPEDEIRSIASVLTIMDGRIVFADGDFREHDPEPPPPSPDWSPLGRFGSPAARTAAYRPQPHARACIAGCEHTCGIHGHAHAIAWAAPLPVGDLRTFWGAVGCSCFGA
jgi:hypothetical protein